MYYFVKPLHGLPEPILQGLPYYMLVLYLGMAFFLFKIGAWKLGAGGAHL
jgi:hypothetical protein